MGLAGRDWQLTAPKAESGKTKEDGLIETEIPPDAKSGTLKVTKIFEAPVIPPDPPAAAAADPSLVVYPRPIAPGEFKDAAPPDPATLENDVEWTLKIGSLPCPKEDAGVIARLENLGYSCGSETSPGPKTAAAVKFMRGNTRSSHSPAVWRVFGTRSLACCFCAAFCKSLPGARRSPIWPI